MEYYIEPAEQTPEVQQQLKGITPDTLNPEELRLLDPAPGSGHILVEAYDLFKAIYQERGYRARDIPRLILENNLFGIEICDRAAQLAAFALMMKARADDRQIFSSGVKPHVVAIQESKGLDAKKTTEALNATLKQGGYKVKEGYILESDVAQLLELFDHAKTFGSLICIPEKLSTALPTIAQRTSEVQAFGRMLEQAEVRGFNAVICQARILADKYHFVITNPPYMSSRVMNPLVKQFAKKEFPNSSLDLFSTFVDRISALTHLNGMMGFITPYVWMFLSSYEVFRKKLETANVITTLIQLEYNAFEPACVPVCTFTLLKASLGKYRGTFIKLSEFKGHQNQAPKVLEAIKNRDCPWRFTAAADDFKMIPGNPIAYWVSDAIRNAFATNPSMSSVAEARQGLATADNERFLRYWFEVPHSNIAFGCTDSTASFSKAKWFPYNKGGVFRKWYGNLEHVVNWQNGGSELKRFPKAVIRNPEFYFREGITWSDVTSSDLSFRYLPPGCIFDSTGHSAFFTSKEDLMRSLAVLNSALFNELAGIVNPTLHFHIGYFNSLPYPQSIDGRIVDIANKALGLSQEDWDSRETSWGFRQNPLVNNDVATNMLEAAFASYKGRCDARRQKLLEIEEEINEIVLKTLGLDHDFAAEVDDNQITLAQAQQSEVIKNLILYAIGCVMGRYSLDKPGLIYAHSGNKGFDASHYKSIAADEDGIIPIMETGWFPNDATNRFIEFVSVVWPKEYLEENLKFIADSLGPNKAEQPRDTVCRYMATGFYKHHLAMYKRRPIYWLFSSGKERAFQCLVYLHRYNEGTLSRMRTEYVIPLQGKIRARGSQLDNDISKVTSTSHRKKLDRERDTLTKQAEELKIFDEKLRHYADMRISLDLDEGVMVNYGKFAGLLAEVKTVCGKAEDED